MLPGPGGGCGGGIIPPRPSPRRTASGRYNSRTTPPEPRPMKVHEYQAKELLAAAVANVPGHVVCTTPDQVAAAFDKLSNGGGVMVKAQIHAGGRGAGQLKGYADKLGGVKFAPTKEKARALAETMFKYPLVTLQT